MTNAAALGWAIDDDADPIVITAPSVGEPTGGPVESYDSSIAMRSLEHPSSESATYSWIDATATDAHNVTHLADFAHGFSDGRTNFTEWYFPTRLIVDLAAVGGARVATDGWQAAAGLRVFDGATIDAPILCIPSQLETVDDCAKVRARVAPIGDGRVHQGATRDTEAGFRTVPATGFTHIDPLSAMVRPDNPVPGAILDFVLGNAAPGTTAPSL
jgi:hypothetical protein